MNCYRKKDLIEKLRVSESTINRWVAGGLLPKPTKVGRVLLWDRSTVDEWLASHQGGTK